MKKKNLVIIDADSMVFIVASRNKRSKMPNMVTMATNKFIKKAIESCEALTPGDTDYMGFYGSKEEGAAKNFRYNIFPEYKGQRKDPDDFVIKWRATIHNAFKNNWNFVPVDGMEADDACGIAYEKYKDAYENIYIVTMDKDLKQFEDTIWFEFKKFEGTKVDAFFAQSFFAEQMLKGDSGDGIPGLHGIGPKKAVSMLEGCTTKSQLKWAVIRAYASYGNVLTEKLTRSFVKNEKPEVEAKMIQEAKDLGVTVTETQIERRVNQVLKTRIEENLEEHFKGGWKAYIEQQYRLLWMLRDVSEVPAESSFVLPDPQEFLIIRDDEVANDAQIPEGDLLESL